MKRENDTLSETLNGSTLGEISVLSPSQRREQERLRKEKEAKDAAEKEKRRQDAAKRRAAEDAAEAEILRQIKRSELGEKIVISLIIGAIVFALTFVFVIFHNPSDISLSLWFGIATGIIGATVYLIKNR